MLHLFSESVKVEIEDIHFVLGPNNSNVSQSKDFKAATAPYDGSNPVDNLKRMYE